MALRAQLGAAAAAIYARISSDHDGTSAAVGRQLEDCRAWAQRHGWAVAEEYVDNDISAYSGKRRPEYTRMLDDLGGGRRDAVLVYHLDRLHRQPRELEEFLDLCVRARVQHLACVTGEVDLATHDGQFHARILGAVARKESDDKSRRLRRKHLEIARAGRTSGGGTRPYGYEADRITVIPEEAERIRELAERILAGESLRSAATDLNERGIRTVTGRAWTPHTVRQMLLGARLSGQREHLGEIVGKAAWPAIITKAQTARLRALLNDPQRRTNRVARKYLLAGLLRCGACGTTMVARPREDHRRRYVCPRDPGRNGCGGTFILADDAETFIVEAVLNRTQQPPSRRLHSPAQRHRRRRGEDDPRPGPRPGAAGRARRSVRKQIHHLPRVAGRPDPDRAAHHVGKHDAQSAARNHRARGRAQPTRRDSRGVRRPATGAPAGHPQSDA